MDLIGEFHPASSKGNRYALTAVWDAHRNSCSVSL